jgi:hypothetical protein
MNVKKLQDARDQFSRGLSYEQNNDPLFEGLIDLCDAIAEPPAIEFRRKPPTASGVYWYMGVYGKKQITNRHMQIVEVFPARGERHKSGRFQYQCIGGHAVRYCDMENSFWAGPLDPPTDPFVKEGV